jgi:hypothetical protein
MVAVPLRRLILRICIGCVEAGWPPRWLGGDYLPARRLRRQLFAPQAQQKILLFNHAVAHPYLQSEGLSFELFLLKEGLCHIVHLLQIDVLDLQHINPVDKA